MRVGGVIAGSMSEKTWFTDRLKALVYSTDASYVVISAVLLNSVLLFFLYYGNAATLPTLTDTNLHQVLGSNDIRVATTALFTVAAQMVFGIALDTNNLFLGKEVRAHWVMRLALLLSLTVVPFVVDRTSGSSEFSVLSYAASNCFRSVLTMGSLLAFIAHVAADTHERHIVGVQAIIICLLHIVGQQLQVFALFDSGPDSQSCQILARSLVGFSQICFLGLYIGRFLSSRRRKTTTMEHCLLIYMLCFVLQYIAIAIIQIYFFKYSYANTTSFELSLSYYVDAALVIVIITIPGRMARMKASIVTKSLEERQAFIRYISHEIRTPLNCVLMGLTCAREEMAVVGDGVSILTQNISLAEHVVPSVAPTIEMLDVVRESCNVALSILNDLLMFDKIETGKMNLELVETGVIKFVEKAAKPFEMQAREKGIKWSIDFSDELKVLLAKDLTLLIDTHKIGQVMRNLLSNAIKFTHRGGSIHIGVGSSFVVSSNGFTDAEAAITAAENDHSQAAAGEGGGGGSPAGRRATGSARGWGGGAMKWRRLWRSSRSAPAFLQSHKVAITSKPLSDEPVRHMLRIEVTDSGAGISHEDQKELFGQYVQFNAGKLQKGEGSGLGLWISKGIVELHGGHIGAHSGGEGKGTMFFMELPLLPRASTFRKGREEEDDEEGSDGVGEGGDNKMQS